MSSTSKLKKYKRVKYLGKGSYGAAILVELKANPAQKFVIKEIVIGHLKPAEQASAKSEAEVLQKMTHSNITMYIESFVENSKLYIVMECADAGDLSAAIQKRKADNNFWSEEETMRMFVQICLALQHVHSCNVLHRDLKSQNVFLTSKGMVKLGDFGIAKVLDATDDQAKTQIGTPYYLSPEICENLPYGQKSDVWSLGVILFEMMALEMPFQATNLPALVMRICNSEPAYNLIDRRYSPALVTLTKHMLFKKPEKRPTVGQIVKTDFVKSHISRLLSFTLRSGTGGANGSGMVLPKPAPAEGGSVTVAAGTASNTQSASAAAAAEKARLQKEKEAQAAAQAAAEQNAKAKAEKERQEKLRKFKQGMMNKKKDEEEKASGGNGGNSTDVSDAKGQPQEELLTAEQWQQREQERQRREQMVREREQQQAQYQQQQQQQRRDIGAAPRVVPPPPSSQRTSAQSSAVSTPRSLADIQAERDGRGSQYSRPQQDPYANAGALVAGRGDPRGSAVPSSGRSDLSSHDRSNSNTSSSAAADGGGGGGVYESAARREYFASRAIAQRAKERVEGEKAAEAAALAAANAVPSQQDMYAENRPVRRRSGGDEESLAAMEIEQQYGGDRVAYQRALREKEKNRERAQREEEIKQQMEENRTAGRARKPSGAVAFEINFNDDPMEDVKPKPRVIVGKGAAPGSSPLSDVAEAKSHWGKSVNSTDDSSGVASNKKKGWGPPIAPKGDLSLARGISNVSATTNDEDSTPDRDRRKQKANTDRASRMFSQPTNGGGGALPKAKNAAAAASSASSSSSAASAVTPPAHDRAGGAGARASAGEAVGGTGSDDHIEDSFDDGDEPSTPFSPNTPGGSQSDAGAGEVMQKIENRRQSQIDGKKQAGEMFKKLRARELQRKAEREKLYKHMSPATPSTGAEPKVHSTVSPVKRMSNAGEGGRSRAPRNSLSPAGGGAGAVGDKEYTPGSKQTVDRRASPMKARLMDVMSQVEQATESVQKVIADSRGARSENSPTRGGRGGDTEYHDEKGQESKTGGAATQSRKTADGGAFDFTATAKTVQDDDDLNVEANSDEEDRELEYTLESWLTMQKRGVTLRSRSGRPAGNDLRGEGASAKGAAPSATAAAAGVDEDAAVLDSVVSGYDTPTMVELLGRGDYADENEYDLTVNGGHVEGFEDYVPDEHEDEDGDINDDVEVVDLQCMLAKALMGDDDDEAPLDMGGADAKSGRR